MRSFDDSNSKTPSKADSKASGPGDLSISAETLWPYTAGELLGSFEKGDIESWQANASSFAPYQSTPQWKCDKTDEGVGCRRNVAESQGSAIWEIPAGEKKAVLTKSVQLDGPVSHFAVDAINCGEAKVEIFFEAKQEGLLLGSKTFLLSYKAGRRLLLPMTETIDPEKALLLSLVVRDAQHPAKIVMDNLRCF